MPELFYKKEEVIVSIDDLTHVTKYDIERELLKVLSFTATKISESEHMDRDLLGRIEGLKWYIVNGW